ncbi:MULTISPECIES: ImmA/IrrE family metallo-endopeptidase [Vibrio]|uniref:IrrE N-terminal-like domain-containing protein n=1 Tax=Vibrio metoecus TaxID=1481663 RepID=A0A0Q0PXI6_VIBMT|nr:MULTISPECIES: ImmA/IrrE family metallo-endopeptidase [Vibrio]EGR0412536.1 ImmA/IrrE family metallo-endopeptidase [Vibrio cholerae]EGR1966258.1 ImmA/IrrE family metallo-endopeptidase [Vibrio cholerae]EHZ6902518.1 ImmA/IrrE family metallo-endopeptidase [Vibrio cholerae]EJK2104164.1 ImmA/IrrE family metallo-endopeptidase [Vibrio cholerae]EJL6462802.1 ImmA/IrrE family metallo-endopeptidase [Vibrio cholerae]
MPNPVSARTILRELWDGSIPVNIENIVRSLSIEIRRTPLRGSGFADIEGGQRVIGINSNDCATRQRFTMAHELGHHALMHSLPRDRDEIASYGIDYYEIEANNFAAEMLMPESSLNKDVPRFTYGGSIQIQPLADLYNVSYDAMYFRLKNLGHG